jgi:hypothetical protein
MFVGDLGADASETVTLLRIISNIQIGPFNEIKGLVVRVDVIDRVIIRFTQT